MKYVIIVSILISVSLSSCGTDGVCNGFRPEEITHLIRVVDEQGESLIASWRKKYDSELVRITSEDGTSYDKLGVPGDGSINIPLLNTEGDVNDEIGKEVIKTYYISLPDETYDLGVDVDTIRFEYMLRKDPDECPIIWPENYKAYYNDNLMREGDIQDITLFYK